MNFSSNNNAVASKGIFGVTIRRLMIQNTWLILAFVTIARGKDVMMNRASHRKKKYGKPNDVRVAVATTIAPVKTGRIEQPEQPAKRLTFRGSLVNRYKDVDPDYDEDLSFEEHLAMSDEELERADRAAERQYIEAWNKLTPLQQYRRSRRNRLQMSIAWKLHEESGLPSSICRENRRTNQIQLLKLRTEFYTSTTPGTA